MSSGADPAPGAPPVASDGAATEHPPAKTEPGEDKFWEAMKLLNSKKAADLAAGRAALQAASDLEYGHAQVLLGNCFLSGSYGFPKNAGKGANLFRLAAEHGNAFAQVSLGQCLFAGTGTGKDLDKARQWLTAALKPEANFARPVPPADYFSTVESESERPAVAGELAADPADGSKATAHYLLGLICTEHKQFVEAQEHFLAAARAGPGGRDGLYPAAIQAALNFAFGNGGPVDLAKADGMLEVARRLGERAGARLIHNYVALKLVDNFATDDLEETISKINANMESNLEVAIATKFADQKAKEYNVAEAVKWYELAANNDQAWAMIALAFIYHRGDLGKPEPDKVFYWLEKAGGGEKPKHLLATANLAICYAQGYGTAKDPAKADALFRKYRDLHIICFLGSIGQAPATLQTFKDSMRLLDTWARDKRDAQAQYLMGLRYLGSWDVPRDVKEAARWLKKAARANHGAAYAGLGYLHESAGAELGDESASAALKAACDCYRKGSELGNVDACVSYAAMLVSGRGVTPDLPKAEATLNRALQLDPNHAGAHNNLAVIYQWRLAESFNRSDPAMKDYRQKMLTEYEKSAGLKFGLAARNLGQLYRDGVLVPQDFRRAYEYFEQAAAEGQVDAHFALGQMHELGQGVPVTFTEAAYHYRLAALEGNIPALDRLVGLYVTGRGVSRDLDRAMFWLDLAVKRGDLNALATMCDVLIEKGDYGKALPLLVNLSKYFMPSVRGFACERLSTCYLKGLGTKVDQKLAAQYLSEAIDCGNGDAIARLAMVQMRDGKRAEAMDNYRRAAATSHSAAYHLGQMYYFGTNVEADRNKAVEYLRKAAESNDPDALYFLAGMTYQKVPGAPALDEAIRFAQQAENEGLQKATFLREKLEERLKVESTAPDDDDAPRPL